MSQHQILEKLEKHINRHPAPAEECQVLYLLAEIRKYLDQQNVQHSNYAVG